MKKLLKWGLILGLIAAFFIWLFVLYLPTKDWYNDMKKEKGGNYTAVQVVKDFLVNEDSATKKYPSDKTLDIDGVVKNTKTENSSLYIELVSGDSVTNISFVMRDTTAKVAAGNNVTLRGTCTGKLLDDIQFNDGVLIKK